MSRFICIALVSLVGCDFYFGGRGKVECVEGAVAPLALRDPNTGQCHDFGSHGICDGEGIATETEGALPDWPPCESPCSRLDQTSCVTTPGCQVAYFEAEPANANTSGRCFGTVPNANTSGKRCEERSPVECATSDACLLDYVNLESGAPSCRGEPTCVSWDDTALVNPATGECEIVEHAGTYCGDGVLGAPPRPDWASCDSSCTALDEASCLLTQGCRAIYQGCPPNAPCIPELDFKTCAPIAPSSPGRGGCDGQDAYGCSLRDHCSWNTVEGCFSEDVCYGELPQVLRNPLTDTCEPVFVVLAPCSTGTTSPNWAECGGKCEDLDEKACLGAEACRAIYGHGDAIILDRFVGCRAVAASQTMPTGSCESLDAAGCSERSDCTSTYCQGLCSTFVPFESCKAEPQPPTCPELADEADCITAGCEPLYEGKDCHCDDSGCGCTEWKFLSCQDITPPLLPKTCGGGGGDIGEVVCPNGYFCDYPDGWCGWNDGVGTCQRVPDSATCPDIASVEICGCDGNFYAGVCATNAAGTDADDAFACRVEDLGP